MILIAEIGWNHMGDMVLAKKMIESAKQAGATHAKFQTWHEKNLKAGPWDEDGRRDIYLKAELTPEKFMELKGMCDNAGVKFLTSIFTIDDVDDMAKITDAEVKIPSPEIANEALISAAAEKFKRIYISTGASTKEEIDKAVAIVNEKGAELILMHCVSLYPCPDDKVNILRINELKEKHHAIGLSDHTQDTLSSILSISMGVVAIEKHFTIDNDLPGRDNKFALLPETFSEIAKAWTRYENMSAKPEADYFPEEQEVRDIYRGRWNN